MLRRLFNAGKGTLWRYQDEVLKRLRCVKIVYNKSMSYSLTAALGISLGLHAALLSVSPAISRPDPRFVSREIEVVPIEKSEEAARLKIRTSLPALPEAPLLSIKDTGVLSAIQKDIPVEKPPLPAWDKHAVADASAASKQEGHKRSSAGADTLQQIAEGLSVSKEKMAEIKSTPVYMGYYNFIREKIRRTATEQYTQTDEGEVTAIFILSRSGAVTAAAVHPQESRASDMLKKIAVESIKRASPFPVFPPELKYGNLEFSITIHFKRKGNF